MVSSQGPGALPGSVRALPNPYKTVPPPPRGVTARSSELTKASLVLKTLVLPQTPTGAPFPLPLTPRMPPPSPPLRRAVVQPNQGFWKALLELEAEHGLGSSGVLEQKESRAVAEGKAAALANVELGVGREGGEEHPSSAERAASPWISGRHSLRGNCEQSPS